MANITDPTTTGYTDTSVSNGTTYTYRVKPYSMVAGVKEFGDAAGPISVAMTGMVIAATPDALLVNSGTSASLSLPFTDTDASATHTATIDWGDATGDTPDTSTGTVTEHSGSTPGTVAGTHSYSDGAYTATVTITNSDGSSTATPIEVEVGGTPNAPTGASASVSGGAVTVSWSAPASGYSPTDYTIYGSTNGGTTWTAIDEVDSSQTSDSVGGLTASTSYIFRITSTNDFGESSATSATASITSPAIPGAPTSPSADLEAGNAALSWTASGSLATGFNIYESTDGGTTFSYLDSVDGSTTSYTATDLTAATTPQFYVTAQDASGESSHSSTVSKAIPTGITSAAATLNSAATTATVTWSPASWADGYLIYRAPDDGSSSPTYLATVTGASSASYSDSTVDPTDAYIYSVTPFAAATAPTTQTGSGTGATTSTTSTATGDIGNFTAAVSGTTVNFTWDYQGSTTGFELEQEDTNVPGTNFVYVQGPTGRIASVSGLNPGDHYQFEIRADRSDGTVSDYAKTSADIPAPPAGDSDEVLTPPSGISDPQPDSPLLPAYWSGTVDGSTDDYDSPDYTEDIGVISDQDNPLHINLGANDASECSFGPTYPSAGPDTFTLDMDGSSGDTYTVGAYFHTGSSAQYPPEGEQYSPLAGSIDITMGGTKAPAPELSLGSPNSDGDPTVNWVLPDGTDAGGIDLYSLTTSNGSSSATLLGYYSGGDTGQATLTDLPLGKSTIFAIDFANGPTSDTSGFSPYSKDLTVTNTGRPPVKPAWVQAVIDPKDAGKADVSWQNSSNNEAGFKLQESVDGGQTWKPVKDFKQDETSTGSHGTVDISDLQPGTVQFQVLSNTPDSQPTKSNTLNIPLIILVSGFQQTAGKGVVLGAGVTQIRQALTDPGGGFTVNEVPAPLPADVYGAAQGAELNIAKAITTAAQNAHGQMVNVAMVGYSFGGGAVYDVETNMTHQPNPVNPFPAMPTNASFVGTVYVDAIIDGFGQQIKNLIHHGLLIAPVTAAPPSAAFYNYCQTSSKNEESESDLPHGTTIGSGDGAVDLDTEGSLKPQLTRYNGPMAQVPDLPATSNKYSHTGTSLGTISIDKDDFLHQFIEDDLRTIFSRPIKKIGLPKS